MKDSLILQDKIYISAKRVHELFGYTSDYVGQLCRAGKLEAKMVGRSWFVTEKSVIDHQAKVEELSKNKIRKGKRKLYGKFVSNKISEIDVVNEIDIPLIPVVESIIDTRINTEIISDIPVENFNDTYPISPIIFSQNVTDDMLEKNSIESSPIEIPSVSFSEDECKVREETSSAELPEESSKISTYFISSSLFKKISIGTCVFVLLLVFVFQTGILTGFKDLSQVENSAASGESFSQKISGLFDGVGKLVVGTFDNIFNRGETRVAQNNLNDSTPVQVPQSSQSIPYNGVAVIPATDSDVQNELIKQRIRESFSDQVFVRPDDSGSSGVITPVFRKTTGEDFLYVMVPVNNAPVP